MGDWKEIIIVGKPIPAVRQSNRDRWNPSRTVQRYRAWRDMVVLSCRAEGLLKLESPVELSFLFAVAGNPTADLDNYIKGIKDSLVYGNILKDDALKQIPRYREPIEAFSLCPFCDKRQPKKKGGFHDNCGSIKKCNKSFAWFRIREITMLDSNISTIKNLDNLDLTKVFSRAMIKLIGSLNETEKAK